MYTINMRTRQKSYPLFLGRGILQNAGPVISRYLLPRPALVVSDKNVADHYAEKCLHSLRRAGFKPYLEVLNGGEKEKSLAAASTLYERALKTGMDRQSVFVALGGGVIGDLTGFAAATYLRGVPFIQVPTTLLAMVDSSIGGKVAVNHLLGKNLIGAFYQPSLVFGDVATLHTLPERELNAGLAEVIKYGIIWDANLFARLEHLSKGVAVKNKLIETGSRQLLPLILRSILIKGKVVYLDEKEKNLRRILNFGHTFGHALETASRYEYYLHGEAVACGMAMAVRLAEMLHILDRVSKQRIINLVARLNLPFPPVNLSINTVMEALFYDKKKEGEELVFVLPSRIGKVFMCKSPPANIVEKVIGEYLQGDLLHN
ncbi:MAG: 3-dehydroquinate synthase [Bacillota bacterium]